MDEKQTIDLIFNKIKARCLDQKKTIREVIAGVGLSDNGWYEMEKNRSLKLRTLIKVAEILNTSPAWFLTDDKNDGFVNEMSESYMKVPESIAMLKNIEAIVTENNGLLKKLNGNKG